MNADDVMEFEMVRRLRKMSNDEVKEILKRAGFEILKSGPSGCVISREDPTDNEDED